MPTDAALECRSLARALSRGPLTPEQAAERTGLDMATVKQRLVRNGPCQANLRVRWFCKREDGRYGLTAAGVTNLLGATEGG